MQKNITKTIHATALVILNTGILITGKAKVGKSELALELLYRGHKLVGDDAIKLTVARPKALIAHPASPLNQSIHLRSIGIINITKHFNEQQTCAMTPVELIIKLIEKPEKQHTTLKPIIKKINMLGVAIDEWTLFSPSNCPMAIKVETLVKQYRMGNSDKISDKLR